MSKTIMVYIRVLDDKTPEEMYEVLVTEHFNKSTFDRRLKSAFWEAMRVCFNHYYGGRDGKQRGVTLTVILHYIRQFNLQWYYKLKYKKS